MDTEHIVQLLIQERDRLNRAIEALSGSTGKRRGRPPKNATPVVIGEPVTPPKKRTWSAAQKKAASRRMKTRWAARKNPER
jgi:hypothetical protein